MSEPDKSDKELLLLAMDLLSHYQEEIKYLDRQIELRFKAEQKCTRLLEVLREIVRVFPQSERIVLASNVLERVKE